MSVVLRGRVRGGKLVLPDPLPMPEGAEVVVSIDAVNRAGERQAMSDDEFLALPFFGMWADREDAEDSVALVREMREAWQRRSQR